MFAQVLSSSLFRASFRSAQLYSTKSIFVGNLSFRVTPEILGKFIEEKVEVKEVRIPTDARGRSKGFGFIEVDDANVETVLNEFHEVELEGRSIRLELTKSSRQGN